MPETRASSYALPSLWLLPILSFPKFFQSYFLISFSSISFLVSYYHYLSSGIHHSLAYSKLSIWFPFLFQSSTHASLLPISSQDVFLNWISLLRALLVAPHFVVHCSAWALCSGLAYLASFSSPHPSLAICIATLSVPSSLLSVLLHTLLSLCRKCLPSVLTWLIFFCPSMLGSDFIPLKKFSLTTFSPPAILCSPLSYSSTNPTLSYGHLLKWLTPPVDSKPGKGSHSSLNP